MTYSRRISRKTGRVIKIKSIQQKQHFNTLQCTPSKNTETMQKEKKGQDANYIGGFRLRWMLFNCFH
jgi:hypothetical protein